MRYCAQIQRSNPSERTEIVELSAETDCILNINNLKSKPLLDMRF
jgi:hypothetical protein